MEDLYLMFFISGCVWMEPRRPPTRMGRCPMLWAGPPAVGAECPWPASLGGRRPVVSLNLFIQFSRRGLGLRNN